MQTHWDAVVIGGGMSGLGAGIRLALFGKKVLLLEQHNLLGGLNSFYFKNGFKYDVGLHAMTNFVPKGTRQKPLTKICRQLRIPYESLALKEQKMSCIRFPDRMLRFNNNFSFFESEIAEKFPSEIDQFRRLVSEINAEDEVSLDERPFLSTRQKLENYFSDPLLSEMLLLPLFYYGSPTPQDIDWRQFVILFKAIYMEGFSRPFGGVRTIIELLRKQYLENGGVLKVKSGVSKLLVRDGHVSEIVLSTGEVIKAKIVLSSIGLAETSALYNNFDDSKNFSKKTLTFLETITILKKRPESFGWPFTIIFYSHSNNVRYDSAEEFLDLDSGVICLPENYESTEYTNTTTLRTTHLSNFENWHRLPQPDYLWCKQECLQRSRRNALKILGEPKEPLTILDEDIFTPLTIKRYTGHFNGAIYGAQNKIRSGQTELKNLFICGTDQGFLGIVGALLSGISIANRYALQATEQ